MIIISVEHSRRSFKVLLLCDVDVLVSARFSIFCHRLQQMSSSLASSLWIFLTACGTILAILLTTKKNPIRRIIVTILAKIQFQWQIARCSQNSNNNNSNSSHDKLAADTSTSCTGGAAVVTGLFVHPVKSLKAVPVETATIGPRGFVGDREYMLVIPASKPLYIIRDDDDDATTTHRFITQRHCPSLARVHVRSITTTIDNEKNTTNSDTIQNALQFTTDILPDTTLTIPTRPLPDAPVYRSTIWGDIVQVQDMGDDAAAFFRSILAQDKESQVTLAENASQVRLVRQMDTDQRTANDKFVPPAARRTIVWGSSSNPPVALADGFPMYVHTHTHSIFIYIHLMTRSSSQYD
jgi:hypothetical protein